MTKNTLLETKTANLLELLGNGKIYRVPSPRYWFTASCQNRAPLTPGRLFGADRAFVRYPLFTRNSAAGCFWPARFERGAWALAS